MRQRGSFAVDDRAIEGLPIRLVIALVVGVAALGIMMSMLGGFTDIGDTEVTLEIESDDIVDNGSTADVEVSVYTEDGDPVEDGEVILTGNGARIDDSPQRAAIGSGADAHRATFSDVEPELRTDQDTGELQFEIVPNADSNYEDANSNPRVTVVQT